MFWWSTRVRTFTKVSSVAPPSSWSTRDWLLVQEVEILTRVWSVFRVAIMADVDPDTLLEWLQMGQGDERDMQLIALEQLCMLLLMSDNVDRCFET